MNHSRLCTWGELSIFTDWKLPRAGWSLLLQYKALPPFPVSSVRLRSLPLSHPGSVSLSGALQSWTRPVLSLPPEQDTFIFQQCCWCTVVDKEEETRYQWKQLLGAHVLIGNTRTIVMGSYNIIDRTGRKNYWIDNYHINNTVLAVPLEKTSKWLNGPLPPNLQTKGYTRFVQQENISLKVSIPDWFHLLLLKMCCTIIHWYTSKTYQRGNVLTVIRLTND